MLVTHSNIQFDTQRTAANVRHERVDIEAFAPRRSTANTIESASTPPARKVTPSQLHSLKSELAASEGLHEESSLDPKLALLKSIIEAITGRLMELFGLDIGSPTENTEEPQILATPMQTSPAQSTNSQAGMRIRSLYEYAEHEAMSFRASGKIATADGKNIEFSIELQMQRSFVERSETELIWGDVPQLKDPLVVNFDGRPVELSADRYAFDINADGTMDQIPGLSPGRAYLILDRNGNGIVDDGREVIGALSGNAFSELKALDEDKNGFVDAGDVSFSQLGLWRPGTTNNRYDSTQDADVAALSTDSLATEFKLANADNEQLGQLRRSSIYVTEAGQVGTTQQIDLVS